MIKMLMGSIRQYKRESLLSPLFVALEVVLECLLPQHHSIDLNNGLLLLLDGWLFAFRLILTILAGVQGKA